MKFIMLSYRPAPEIKMPVNLENISHLMPAPKGTDIYFGSAFSIPVAESMAEILAIIQNERGNYVSR